METPNGKMKVGMQMFSNEQLRTVNTIMTMPERGVDRGGRL